MSWLDDYKAPDIIDMTKCTLICQGKEASLYATPNKEYVLHSFNVNTMSDYTQVVTKIQAAEWLVKNGYFEVMRRLLQEDRSIG